MQQGHLSPGNAGALIVEGMGQYREKNIACTPIRLPTDGAVHGLYCVSYCHYGELYQFRSESLFI